ncbi:MAG: type II toxin-antitoxin system RelE/ParE family toxin [Thermomicrobiales bacterium]
MPSSRNVEFSHEAEADPREILQYTDETWGETQRDAYAAALNDAFSQLAEYPELGPARPALFSGCRVRRVQEHVNVFRIRRGSVSVIRVLHSRVDTPMGMPE